MQRICRGLLFGLIVLVAIGLLAQVVITSTIVPHDFISKSFRAARIRAEPLLGSCIAHILPDL